ncbi:MAG: hypothetical protein KGD74_03620, partial [Candidatus Lokiarchaeota archaeon]|nr:hypothetical protein [Candidatus Lokiarchaeota archaeon]
MLKIEIKTETIPMDTGLETSMETQEMKVEPETHFKKIHYILFIFVFIQVLFYMTFSEPLTVLIGGEPIWPWMLNDDVISRTA